MQWSYTTLASRGPRPGTCSSSARLAWAALRAEPKWRTSWRRRVSPTPGMPSSTLAGHGAVAQLAVVGDGEAVGLVADPLQQVEGLAGPGDDHRVGHARHVHLLHPLGQRHHRQVGAGRGPHRLQGGGQLGPAPVDHDQVRRVGELPPAPARPRAGRARWPVGPGGGSGPRAGRRRRPGPRPSGSRSGGTRSCGPGRPRTPPSSRRPGCPGGWRCRSTRSAAGPRAGRGPPGAP